MRIVVPVLALLFGLDLASSAFARDDNQGAFWGAIAAAVQGSNAVVRVVTDLPSRAAAEQAALAECRKAGVGGCRIGSVFADGGCGYATTGSAPRGKTGATVGWGKSPQDAINSA
jgi:Domain of unknown function (DUF4189)